MHDPKVYLVFWGPTWPAGAIPAMQDLFAELAGGMYNNILAQYYDTNGPIHNDTSWAGTLMDNSIPPTSLTMDQIGQEGSRALSAHGLTNDSNTLVIVYPQDGTTYDASIAVSGGTCGKHGYAPTGNPTLIYAFVHYACNDTQNPITATQYYTSHEYAEAVTDPKPHSGWAASNGDEIGDLCNQGGQTYSPVDHTYIQPPSSPPPAQPQLWVTSLWDNSTQHCQWTLGQEYLSPDTTSPFQGKHTVQGAILTQYVQLGQDTSMIGPPISEETPIASGRVSYFTGRCGSNYPTGNCAAIYWSPATGAHFVRGSEYQKYVQFGEANGVLGFPVTDDASISGGSVTYFAATPCSGGGPNGSSSAIYWSAATGSHEVHGCIYHEYSVNQNGPYGRLGFPVSDEYTNSAGNKESDFQGGNIQWINGVAYTQLYPHCVNPTAMYGRTGGNWNLLWYGNADPTGGSGSWASGTGNTVGTSWDGSVFSGGNGIIYRIDSNNNLWWYRHLGASNGTFNWQGGKQVGNGWGFSYVFSAGNGVIYGVDNAGNLHWYKHLGYADGSSSWASGSGAIVGNGWGYSSTGIAYVFSGGNGIIYAVFTDGTLRWYRHLGYLTGSSSWASGSGKIIGTGWDGTYNTIDAFSAGGGIIFRIDSNGNLYWYDDLGYQSGLASWANGGQGKQIGVGWDALLGSFADVNACQ